MIKYIQQLINNSSFHKDFLCVPCGARDLYKVKVIRSECIFNIYEKTDKENYKDFYSAFLSAKLFYYKNNLPDMNFEYGIEIFSHEISMRKNIEYHNFLNLERNKWSIIGADIFCGDLFIDFEKEIYFVNHEALYDKPTERDLTYLAKDIDDFLEKLLNNPIPYISSSWRYMDGNVMNQWCPIRVL